MGPEGGCAVGGGAGQGAGWGNPHPGHHRARGRGEDCGEGWQAVGGGVQAAVWHQPGGEPGAQDQDDGGAVAVEDADLPGPVDGAEGKDGGGGEQHVHPIVGVVGQGQRGGGHLVASLVHVEVGLAVKLLPHFGHVLLLLHHVQVLAKLLAHQLVEHLVHSVKGITDNICLQPDTVWERSSGTDSVSSYSEPLRAIVHLNSKTATLQAVRRPPVQPVQGCAVLLPQPGEDESPLGVQGCHHLIHWRERPIHLYERGGGKA